MEKTERRPAPDSDAITENYFGEILLEARHIDAAVPDLTFRLFGESFKTPVMTAALSHLKGMDGADGMVQQAEAAKAVGAVNWIGMSSGEQFAQVMKVGAPTIRIIKPYADEAEIFRRIDQAVELGALAVGMDIAHSFNRAGQPDHVLGMRMAPKSARDIERYCAYAKLPFVIKDVLSAADARKAVDAGAAGILVGHHHGIVPSAIPPLMALGEIAAAVGGRVPIFVDCGITNGVDAFKALALGASAVCVGRPLMQPIALHGAAGAARTLSEITDELAGAMAYTATASLNAIDRSLLWRRDGRRLFPEGLTADAGRKQE